MNRNINRLRRHNVDVSAKMISPLHRPGRQIRQESEIILRDMAYVLHLVGRVKAQIVTETAAAF